MESKWRPNGQYNIAQPAATTHRVAAGDTLYNIAQRYNMNVAAFDYRQQHPRQTSAEGQVLKLAGSLIPERNAVRNVSYTVRKGDTLNTIASRFNVDIKRHPPLEPQRPHWCRASA